MKIIVREICSFCSDVDDKQIIQNPKWEQLTEKEFCIFINLQRRKNTYIYSSVREKRKQS